jgi:hypothetical protein
LIGDFPFNKECFNPKANLFDTAFFIQKGGKTLMECANPVDGFCKSQKSMTVALVKFVEWFMADYKEEDRVEQEVLAQCVQQLFRKYYYSALDPDMLLTPAKIVTTLCEREFGNRKITVPILDCTFKGKKISRMQYHFMAFGVDNHPLVNDLTLFLEGAAAGIRMEAPGIPHPSEYSKLKKQHLLVFDRHYLNFIGLAALEAGYIECFSIADQIIGQTTAKAQEYYTMTDTAKLQRLLELAVLLCSQALSRAFPELHKEFSVLRIAGFLRNPGSFETVMETVYKKMGLDLKRLDYSLLSGNIDVTLQALHANEVNLIKIFEVQRKLDIHFFTPFGYYLQMIQPVYPDIYDLGKELDELLVDPDNFQAVRNKLFSVAIDFDLTVLGEQLAEKGQKPRRKRDIPERFGDRELCQAVLASTIYVEAQQESFTLDDAGTEMFFPSLALERAANPASKGKEHKTQIIPFPIKQAGAPQAETEQVFVFKVKMFYAKRVWRQIEIRGAQSLHDLHWAIFNAFDFEGDHLYAFYLSNKLGDVRTEYIHPQGEGRPADQARISRLGLELKQKIAYIFDFGARRRLEVELVDRHAVAAGRQYPRESKRNKPTGVTPQRER